MFTGIVTNLGEVASNRNHRLKIRLQEDLISRLDQGVSIAVNGICLTVVNLSAEYLEVDYMDETGKRTNIRYLKSGDLVNLELPVTVNTFLAGHIIQGHVDGVARLEGVIKEGNSRILKFSMPNILSKYIVEKGSIALNGISLTVITAGKNHFTVGIIPFTWDKTMLHILKMGDFVNIEVDILAKYLGKLVKA